MQLLLSGVPAFQLFGQTIFDFEDYLLYSLLSSLVKINSAMPSDTRYINKDALTPHLNN